MAPRKILGILTITAFSAAAILFLCAAFTPASRDACGGMSPQAVCPAAAQTIFSQANFQSAFRLTFFAALALAAAFLAVSLSDRISRAKNEGITEACFIPIPVIADPIRSLLASGVLHPRLYNL